MKYIALTLSFPLLLAGCTTEPKASEQPRAGMANPASVYCLEKGGELIPIQTPQGVRTDCKLPNGETIDEWTLWRRDHPQS